MYVGKLIDTLIRKLKRRVQTSLLTELPAKRLTEGDIGNSLIIAPHADDEVIGAYGVISRTINVQVIVATNCATGEVSARSRETVISERKKEFVDCMKFVGCENYTFIKEIFSDELMWEYGKLERHLSNVNWEVFDSVFIPHSLDNHGDHVALNKFVKSFIRKNGYSNIRIFGYEVWTPIMFPTHFLDITEQLDTKINAVGIYKSQIRHVDYCAGVSGIARYRGMQFGVQAAEAYLEESI